MIKWLIVVAALMTAACDSNRSAEGINGRVGGCEITPYGNGVYYFDCNQQEFGKALSDFKAKGYKPQAITGDGTCAYGSDCGYWVVE